MYRCHILSIKTHPCRELLDNVWQEFFPDSPSFCTFNMLTSTAFPCDFKVAMTYTLPYPPWTYPNIHIDDSLANDQVKELGPIVANVCYQHHINDNYPDYLAIFTDGSKSEKGCGSSFFIPSLNFGKSTSLPSLCSAFSTELFAILSCLRWVQLHRPPKVLIACDSLSSLNALHSVTFGKIHNNLVVKAFISATTLISQGIDIVFLWTPGHQGIIGNEKADKLAKRQIPTSTHRQT